MRAAVFLLAGSSTVLLSNPWYDTSIVTHSDAISGLATFVPVAKEREEQGERLESLWECCIIELWIARRN